MILFHFIFRKKKKNHRALDAEDSWSVWGRGALFFPRCFGNQADGWPLDYIRGHVWCLPAVEHVTTFTVGRGENFPSAFHFPFGPRRP